MLLQPTLVNGRRTRHHCSAEAGAVRSGRSSGLAGSLCSGVRDKPFPMALPSYDARVTMRGDTLLLKRCGGAAPEANRDAVVDIDETDGDGQVGQFLLVELCTRGLEGVVGDMARRDFGDGLGP
jgi:hypothetical protein